MKKLLITVSPTGEVSVKVEGVAGESCVGATAFLEAGLGGAVESRELTTDYYEPAVESGNEIKHGS